MTLRKLTSSLLVSCALLAAPAASAHGGPKHPGVQTLRHLNQLTFDPIRAQTGLTRHLINDVLPTPDDPLKHVRHHIDHQMGALEAYGQGLTRYMMGDWIGGGLYMLGAYGRATGLTGGITPDGRHY